MRDRGDIRRDYKIRLARAIKELRYDHRAQMDALRRHITTAGRTFGWYWVRAR